jgi:hypothetical protein
LLLGLRSKKGGSLDQDPPSTNHLPPTTNH